MKDTSNVLRYLRLRTGPDVVTVVVTDDLNLIRGDELQFKHESGTDTTTYLFDRKVTKLIYAIPEAHPEDFINSQYCHVIIDYHFFAIEVEIADSVKEG